MGPGGDHDSSAAAAAADGSGRRDRPPVTHAMPEHLSTCTAYGRVCVRGAPARTHARTYGGLRARSRRVLYIVFSELDRPFIPLLLSFFSR